MFRCAWRRLVPASPTRNLAQLWDLNPRLEFPLGRLVRELCSVFQNDLVSLILFGFDRTRPYLPETDEIRLLLVFSHIGSDQLRRMVEPLAAARHELMLDPLVFSSEDLRRSLDVFPLQIIEIKRNYQVLHGADVLAGIKLQRCDTRLAVEREVKTVLSRLRHLYILRSRLRPAWLEAIQDTAGQVLRLVGFCLVLAGQRPAATVESQCEQAHQYLGLDAGVLSRAYQLKLGKQRNEAAEMAELFEAYLDNIGLLAGWVDQLRVNS